jgi:hypothetical protein
VIAPGDPGYRNPGRWENYDSDGNLLPSGDA